MSVLSGELRLRFFSALVLIPVCLGILWLGGVFAAMLCAVVSAALVHELSRMHRLPLTPYIWVAMLAGMLASLSVLIEPIAVFGLALLGGLSAMVPAKAARRQVFLWTVLSILASAGLIWMRVVPDNGFLLCLTLLLIVWATDTGAYLIGKALKGPLLMPIESPNKTWAGAIGGIVLACLTGILLSLTLQGGTVMWGLWALLISVTAQMGDWAESRLKRRCKLKNSGDAIPGHGGLLDRLDSLLVTVPLTVAILAIYPWLHPLIGGAST